MIAHAIEQGRACPRCKLFRRFIGRVAAACRECDKQCGCDKQNSSYVHNGSLAPAFAADLRLFSDAAIITKVVRFRLALLVNDSGSATL
jgi:hypothetical protein